MKYSNTEIWQRVEDDLFSAGDVIEDQEGSQLIFTGKSFQLYYSDIKQDKQYIGFVKGDILFGLLKSLIT